MVNDTDLVVPGTGESLSLDAPLPDLARAIADVRDIENDLRTAKKVLADEIHRRMDRERKWTLAEGDFKVTGESDAPKMEWDAQRLDVVLEQLVMEDKITHAAHVAAVETEVAYKVHQNGLKALLKNPALAERLLPCGREVGVEERQRRVKVERVR